MLVTPYNMMNFYFNGKHYNNDKVMQFCFPKQKYQISFKTIVNLIR